MSVCTFISVKSTLNFDLSEHGPCFFRFNMIMWNAGMAYGYEVTSQLSFWLVTTLTDFYFHWAKPAHCPVFPFCPATVTQTWLLAQALTRMHINTISCSTGFNAHTHTHTRQIHTPYLIQVLRLTPNQVSLHWFPSVSQSWPETDGFHRRTINSRRCRHSHCACIPTSTTLMCPISYQGQHVFLSLCIMDRCVYVYGWLSSVLGCCCWETFGVQWWIMHPNVAQPVKYL